MSSVVSTNSSSAPVRQKIALWVCALLLVGLHCLIPLTAAPLSQGEPSYAGQVFSWVSNPTKQSLHDLKTSTSALRGCVPFTLVCAALFAVYAWVLRMLRGPQTKGVHRILFIAGGAAMLSYIFSPVMSSTDVFAYAMYGRAMSVYGGSPYGAEAPFPKTDPFYIQFEQDFLPSWYGPVWTFISAGVTWLTGENLGLTVLVFRLVAIAGALAASGFIWSSLRKYSPENSARGLVLFLWNPLVLMETGLSGHNDSVMLAFACCGVWLHLRGHKAAAVMALTFSALVKFLTGMLVPLYMLLVLRETRSWRGRAIFVFRSAAPAAAAGFLFFHFAKADTEVPVAQSATSPDFYLNNFHELIFKAIRSASGEGAESANVSVYFQGYWVRLRDATDLRVEKSVSSPPLRRAEAGEDLLMIAPELTAWKYVYDPQMRRKCYFFKTGWEQTKPPASSAGDKEARELEKVVIEQRTVVLANRILRIVTWLGFVAFGLFAAWKTRSFPDFLVWSGASLLASYYFIITEIWPWYVNWSLAFAALAPGRLPARLAVFLSAGVLTLYLTIGFEGSNLPWIFWTRGLLAFVLPLLIFCILWLFRWRRKQPCVSAA